MKISFTSNILMLESVKNVYTHPITEYGGLDLQRIKMK